MLFIIIAISGFILGVFLLFWALFAQSKQMTNDFHFDPDEYGLREHVEVKRGNTMFKKTIVIGVLLLAAGCSGPAKSLRVISEAQRSKKVSYTAKDLIIRALYASYIGDTLIERNYVAPASEIQQIAKEIQGIDRKFKTRVIQDTAYTKLFVWW